MVYNPVGERGQGEEYVLVNPQIVKYGKNQDVFAEGCLSFPTFGSDPKKAPTIEADVEVGFLTYSFPPQPPPPNLHQNLMAEKDEVLSIALGT
jgi:hypothetical protein